MKQKPNIDAFIAGGDAKPRKDLAEQADNEIKKQFVVMLPIYLINKLKKISLELSIQANSRVTQQSLVIEAIEEYLKDK